MCVVLGTHPVILIPQISFHYSSGSAVDILFIALDHNLGFMSSLFFPLLQTFWYDSRRWLNKAKEHLVFFLAKQQTIPGRPESPDAFLCYRRLFLVCQSISLHRSAVPRMHDCLLMAVLPNLSVWLALQGHVSLELWSLSSKQVKQPWSHLTFPSAAAFNCPNVRIYENSLSGKSSVRWEIGWVCWFWEAKWVFSKLIYEILPS